MYPNPRSGLAGSTGEAQPGDGSRSPSLTYVAPAPTLWNDPHAFMTRNEGKELGLQPSNLHGQREYLCGTRTRPKF